MEQILGKMLVYVHNLKLRESFINVIFSYIIRGKQTSTREGNRTEASNLAVV